MITKTFLIKLFIFSACLIIGLGLPYKFSLANSSQSCDDIAERIKMGQAWIVNAQLPDGLFTYEYRPLEDKFTDDDNIVRQVGTFWALIESLGHGRNDKVLETIEKFRTKISTMVIRAKAGEDDIAYIDFKGLGKINTSALYTLSLLSLKDHGIELTEREKKDLPLFIKGMRLMSDEKGGFWYIYYLAKERNKITSYGSGEALFALAKYYDDLNDIDNLEWTYKAFLKYYDRYLKNEDDFQATEARAFFSWGIYALSIINKKFPIEYDKSVKLLLKTAFDKRESNPKCQHKGCLLAPNIGDATFFEGMVQAHKMALQHEKDEKEIKKLRNYLYLALDDYSHLQITDVKKFRREYGFSGKAENVKGAFCWDSRCNTTRNDLTQHALSALMYYSSHFCSADKTENSN